MSLLIFSKNFVRNISHPKKNSVGCYHKCTLSSSKVTIIIVRFSRKMDFLDRFSKKYSNIKFYGNPSSGSRVILYGQTNRRIDRHDETNRRFLQFCEHAKNETYFKSLPSVEKKELVHGGKGLGAVLELLRKWTISLNPGNVVISVKLRTMKGKVVAALNYALCSKDTCDWRESSTVFKLSANGGE